MSAGSSPVDFSWIIPEAYRSKAEAFARSLHEKLISLVSVASFNGNNRNYCEKSDELEKSDSPRGSEKLKFSHAVFVNRDGSEFIPREDKETCFTRVEEDSPNDRFYYDVPHRVLRESSSASSLDKHFSNNLRSTKMFSRSGDAFAERLAESSTSEEGQEESETGKFSFRGKAYEPGEAPAIRVTGNPAPETDSQIKLRRCSSLKTCAKSPDTRSEKKIVRFADALGLDLADVRTFLDEIPKIPNSAYKALHFSPILPARPPIPTLIPKFIQPASRPDFFHRVKNAWVSLETALLTDTTVLTISGCIRVRNIAYEKSVYVRYSIDNWRTFSDLPATYISSSCQGLFDMFSFVIYAHKLDIGQILEFAIRFDCNASHYWDNNNGKNYVFECLPQSPSTCQLSDAPSDTPDTFSHFY